MVLVVDDDTHVREAIEGLLKSARFGAASFSSAEDVLESGLLAKASCVISDVRMPGMHGVELLQRIKRDFPALPVIMISGRRDEQVRQSALAQGAVVFLFKPVEPDDLLHAIHLALNDPEKKI
jgi:FixJ family two-component response regulator